MSEQRNYAFLKPKDKKELFGKSPAAVGVKGKFFVHPGFQIYFS